MVFDNIGISEVQRVRGYKDYIIELEDLKENFVSSETFKSKQKALSVVFQLMKKHNIKSFTYEVIN